MAGGRDDRRRRNRLGLPNVSLDDLEGALAVLRRLQEQPLEYLHSLQRHNIAVLEEYFNWDRVLQLGPGGRRGLRRDRRGCSACARPGLSRQQGAALARDGCRRALAAATPVSAPDGYEIALWEAVARGVGGRVGAQRTA